MRLVLVFLGLLVGATSVVAENARVDFSVIWTPSEVGPRLALIANALREIKPLERSLTGAFCA